MTPQHSEPGWVRADSLVLLDGQADGLAASVQAAFADEQLVDRWWTFEKALDSLVHFPEQTLMLRSVLLIRSVGIAKPRSSLV
jgi:hypothetical protein